MADRDDLAASGAPEAPGKKESPRLYADFRDYDGVDGTLEALIPQEARTRPSDPNWSRGMTGAWGPPARHVARFQAGWQRSSASAESGLPGA